MSTVTAIGTSNLGRSTCSDGPAHRCRTEASDGSVESVTTSISGSSVRTTSSAARTTASSLFSTSLQPAAVSATSTSNAESPQAVSHDSNFSTTVFAGATVGCFVAGAMIAGLVACLLLRKRSRRDKHVAQHNYAPRHDHAYVGEKGVPMISMNVVTDNSFLPPQADDAEVKRRVLNLTDQIDQHVENFYSSEKIHAETSVEAMISRYETRQMPNPLPVCFEMANHPLALIKHCLAFHVFTQTIAPGEDTQLMLPPEIAGMVAAMYNKCLLPTTSQDIITAFSSWKRLTGYLQRDLGVAATAPRKPSGPAMHFAQSFSTSFSTWSNSQYPEQYRVHHLATLVDHAIETATWLFRQSDGYSFSWNTLSHSNRDSKTHEFAREVVIVPGIRKTTYKGILLSGNGQNIVQAIVKEF